MRVLRMLVAVLFLPVALVVVFAAFVWFWVLDGEPDDALR